MKSKENLKKKLFELIKNIDDEALLKTLNEDILPYIIQKHDTKTGEFDDLTREQQKKLKAAIAEADRGETVSQREFNKALAHWITS
ncbi:MAG: hypothetical protein JST75_05375 [Bacteroidetes bacterium]|nr:hypothetical protein [Bacteroidota bacterium]